MFCSSCGAEMETRAVGGRERPVCPRCGRVHWDDPKVAVGVIVAIEGRILLGRRAHEPKYGLWSFPSGFVDAGEVPEEAAAREALEETGLEVRIERLIGVYGRRGERTIFIAYAGSVTGGTLTAGDECLEVGVFMPDALPPLAFDHDDAIIAAWLAGEGAH